MLYHKSQPLEIFIAPNDITKIWYKICDFEVLVGHDECECTGERNIIKYTEYVHLRFSISRRHFKVAAFPSECPIFPIRPVRLNWNPWEKRPQLLLHHKEEICVSPLRSRTRNEINHFLITKFYVVLFIYQLYLKWYYCMQRTKSLEFSRWFHYNDSLDITFKDWAKHHISYPFTHVILWFSVINCRVKKAPFAI